MDEYTKRLLWAIPVLVIGLVVLLFGHLVVYWLSFVGLFLIFIAFVIGVSD